MASFIDSSAAVKFLDLVPKYSQVVDGIAAKKAPPISGHRINLGTNKPRKASLPISNSLELSDYTSQRPYTHRPLPPRLIPPRTMFNTTLKYLNLFILPNPVSTLISPFVVPICGVSVCVGSIVTYASYAITEFRDTTVGGRPHLPYTSPKIRPR